MNKLLWYLTLSASVWITYFGSISSFIGEVYPFQIFVVINFCMIILKKEIKVNKIIAITLLLFIFILIYGFTSLYWVDDQSVSVKKAAHYLIGILFLIQFTIIVNRYSKLRQSIHVFSVNFYLVMLISILEIISGNYHHATHFIQTNNVNSFGYHFPLVMFNNTNDLAVFLFLFFPIALYNLLDLKKFKKTTVFTVYLITTFIIYNTESRLGIFLIILYGVLFLLYSMLYHVKNRNLKLFFLLISTSSVAIFLIFESTFINNIFDAIKYDPRITLFNMALDSFSKTFTLGFGIGGLYNITSINIHNYILEIFFEFGLLVFALYFSWLVYIYTKLNKVKSVIYSENILVFYLKLNIL
ncbi:O-antigen ligase family protein, partial [Paenibacillus endophyticus]